jgi:hypothetical protein
LFALKFIEKGVVSQFDKAYKNIKQNTEIHKVSVCPGDIFNYHPVTKPHDTQNNEADKIAKYSLSFVIQTVG